MSKKENTIIVFYDEFERKNQYRLNGVDVSDTIEMLKDKWEKEVIETKCKLFELDLSIHKKYQKQLALTEKALELACEEMIEDLQFDSEDDRHYALQENIEYFKTMAKKEIVESE